MLIPTYEIRLQMSRRRPVYKWFYDHMFSRGYDPALKWFLLPFGGEARFRRVMTAPLVLEDQGVILDLCCGTGSSSLVIRDKAGAGARIFAADLSIGQLRAAKRKSRCQRIFYVEADATTTPFPSSHFDTVVIPHALHEMPHDTRVDVLREARRVVRETGRVAVLELDDPPSRLQRLLLGLWLGYWLPYPLNFENPTRRDMVRRGLVNEMTEAGFARTQKISRYSGAMQVVVGWDQAEGGP